MDTAAVPHTQELWVFKCMCVYLCETSAKV